MTDVESNEGADGEQLRALGAAWRAELPTPGFADRVLVAWKHDAQAVAAPGGARPVQRSVGRGRLVAWIAAAAAAAAVTTYVWMCAPSAPGVRAERSAEVATEGVSSTEAAASPPIAEPLASEVTARVQPVASDDPRLVSPEPRPLHAPLDAIAPLSSAPNQAAAPDSAGSRSVSEIEQVIRAHRPAIRELCWKPLESSPGPDSARVLVKLSIRPDGRVGSASASGGDGYPTLAECVRRRVLTMVFPAADDSTDIHLPFVFTKR